MKLPNGITRQVGRQVLLAQKNSPRMLFFGGVIGIGVSTVMACRATLKLSDQLDKMKAEIDDAKALVDNPDTDYDRKDAARVYIRNAARVARLYAPAAVVGTASVAALNGSRVILEKRNVGLTAAYAAMAKAYDDYRERVREELGEEKERDIYHAVSIETVIDEDGKKIEKKVANPSRWSPYAKFFDEGSRNWQKNAELNLIFVQVQQQYFNDLLRARGHVFLNEVYNELGFDHTSEGALVGWVWGGDGDNHIDFGLDDPINEDFNLGLERSALLDFNVDGVIYDKL